MQIQSCILSNLIKEDLREAYLCRNWDSDTQVANEEKLSKLVEEM